MAGAERPKIVIAGAGLAGALLANYLGRAGCEVDLYERRGDPRSGEAGGGRSINLAISERGLHALRGIGLEGRILEMAVPMRGRMIHARDGALSFQPYDRDPRRCINSISRGGLNRALIEAAAAHPGVRLHFHQRCVDADLDAPAARFRDERDGRESEVACDLLIGADGAFSAVRRAMQRLDRFNYSQSYLDHGYKELHIPPAEGGGFRMERNALHIWPRRAFMMIALPNPDGSFTATCFWPLEGENSFANLRSAEDVRGFFEEQFPDALSMMPTLAEDFFANPTSTLVTIRCGPWHHRDRAVLLGDAAHAIVPFYGQGMNAAFEDCVALDACLRESPSDRAAALAAFYQRRKPHADAIADLALENFIEMRDKSGSRVFQAYKKMERTLHGLIPEWYTPLYTMVSFTTIPYAEARKRARRQDRWVYGTIVAGVVLDVLVIVVAVVWAWRWIA